MFDHWQQTSECIGMTNKENAQLDAWIIQTMGQCSRCDDVESALFFKGTGHVTACAPNKNENPTISGAEEMLEETK